MSTVIETQFENRKANELRELGDLRAKRKGLAFAQLAEPSAGVAAELQLVEDAIAERLRELERLDLAAEMGEDHAREARIQAAQGNVEQAEAKLRAAARQELEAAERVETLTGSLAEAARLYIEELLNVHQAYINYAGAVEDRHLAAGATEEQADRLAGGVREDATRLYGRTLSALPNYVIVQLRQVDKLQRHLPFIDHKLGEDITQVCSLHLEKWLKEGVETNGK